MDVNAGPLKAKNFAKLISFETTYYQIMPKASWTDHQTKAVILVEMRTERGIFDNCKEEKAAVFQGCCLGSRISALASKKEESRRNKEPKGP